MPEIQCPDCRETMEIERDWYGRKVSCPSCQYKFTAEEQDARRNREGDFEDDRPRKKRSRFRDEDERPKRSNKGLFVTLGIIGGVLLLAVCGCGGWGVWMFNSPVKYTDPWVNQSLTDGTASIQFPRSPKAFPLENNDSDTVGSSYRLIENAPKDAAFSFAFIDFGEEENNAVEIGIKAYIDGVKKEIDATVQSDLTLPAYNQTIREVVFRYSNSTLTTRFVKVKIRGTHRLIIIAAGGRNVSEADRKKFFDSFQLTAGKK